MALPTWTDIGGFWVSAGGFVLAIVLAIIGWVQAHAARADAKVARQQAQAARDLADEAQRQTVIARQAAEASEEQAKTLKAALAWDTVPQLTVTAGADHLQAYDDGEVRRSVLTSYYEVKNTGKAAAHDLTVTLLLGTASFAVAPFAFYEVAGGSAFQLIPRIEETLPPFQQLCREGIEPQVQLDYRTPTGDKVSTTKPVIFTP